MKIRTNFVSNSSSSSFVVLLWDYMKGKPIKISQLNMKRMTKFGFWFSSTYIPSEVMVNREKNPKGDKMQLNYSVGCNQDEVMEFLIKNGISFHASVHHDHEFYEYIAKHDRLVIARNFGNEYFMYGSSTNGSWRKGIEWLDQLSKEEPIKVTTGKAYAKSRGLKIGKRK